jgi:hypothetical protein
MKNFKKNTQKLFPFFVSVFSKTFFAFVGSHLVSLSLLTAWHRYNVLNPTNNLLKIRFHLIHKRFCGFECRYKMFGNNNCGVF